MRDIVIFTSPASAGKDYLLGKFLERFDLVRPVSHTTRAPRIGETDGKDYYFTSVEEFQLAFERSEFIETTTYVSANETLYYGFHKEEFARDGNKIMILNPEGINQLINNGYGNRMVIVYIIAPVEERIERYFKRIGQNPTTEQLAEGFLRLLRDIDDFTAFENHCQFKENYFIYRGVPTLEIFNHDNSNLDEIMKTMEKILEKKDGWTND